MSKQSGRSVAVTGAGSGLGRDIACQLASKAYVVFGTAFAPAEVQDLKEASGGRVRLTVCDLTKPDAVRAWASGVSDSLGDDGLDLLINNAGILTPGPIEVLPLEAIRREFDVNVFGALSVINAFLPALRKARGRIVQVSTWTASVPLPFNGPSGASKAAMEVFSAVYRAELKSFGIDVVVAAAGNMRTGGPAKTAAALEHMAGSMTLDQRALYSRAFDTFANKLNTMQGSGLDAASAARRVIELAEEVPAPSRGAVGADAEGMLRAAREKTDAELDALRLEVVGLSTGASLLAAAPAANAQTATAKADLILVDSHDQKAIRNVNNVLTLYQMMINEHKAEEGTAKFLVPGYIQHNPLIADGSVALGKYFAGVKSAHPSAHIVVHRIIGVGDYVFAHVNFVNLLSDDPNDAGVAGVDIYKMNAEGKATEHWDTLQLVGNPENSAPWVGPSIARANQNGMF
jgi:NAD(P)-dependent dehydrogenase (short-subunit alcohol dehydrogenase family)/predicted SnoaL-like aldol condensation-catalyzing enzyme